MSTLDKLGKKLEGDDRLFEEAQALLSQFMDGEISFEEWQDMPPFLRGCLAGTVAGNFGSHHPRECWDWLLQVKNRRKVS